MRNSIPKFPDFNAAAKQFTFLMVNLPVLIGKEAENHFKDSFKNKAWEGVQWEERKRKDKNPKRRALLVKTGRLRRSIRIREVSFGKVVVGTDVPYAQIHNEGGIITGTQNVSAHTVRAHKRRGSEVAAHTVPAHKRKGTAVSSYSVGAHTRRGGKVEEHQRVAHVRTVNIAIPKRQFMGESPTLNRNINKLIEEQVNHVFERYL